MSINSLLEKTKEKLIAGTSSIRHFGQIVKGRKAVKGFDKDSLYVICTGGIGDVLFAAQAVSNRENVYLITKSNYKGLENCCDGLHFISDTQMLNCLKYYFNFTKKYRTENCLFVPIDGFNDYYKAAEKNKADIKHLLWRYYCEVFAVDFDSMKNCSVSARGDCSEGFTSKDILLFPTAYSIDGIDRSFWMKLADKLRVMGYSVYCNSVGNESVIPGTEPISLSFTETCKAAEDSAGCIMLRSGMCDLLAMKSSAKLFIVDTSQDYMDIWHTDFFRDYNIYGFLFKDKDILLNEIINMVENCRD